MNKYYVYAFLDPNKPVKYHYDDLDICFLYEPFYIGKGTKNRINRHFHKDSLRNETNLLKKRKIEKIFKSGLTPIKCKIYENLSEKESLLFENKFINLIGRRDKKTGCLCNMDNGGNMGGFIVKTKRPICQYSKSGILINRFDSISEAAEKLKISKGNIHSCCKGKITCYKNYVWKYELDNFSYIEKTRTKKIVQIINNEPIIYNSIKEFCSKNNLIESNVIDLLKGRRKNILNVKYYNEIYDLQFQEKRNSKIYNKKCNPIIQLSVNGEFIKEWPGAVYIQKELGYLSSTIIGCCRKRRKTAYRFKWIYKNNI